MFFSSLLLKGIAGKTKSTESKREEQPLYHYHKFVSALSLPYSCCAFNLGNEIHNRKRKEGKEREENLLYSFTYCLRVMPLT